MNYFDLHRKVRNVIEHFETIRDLMDDMPVEKRDQLTVTSLKMYLFGFQELIEDNNMVPIIKSIQSGTKGICRYCGCNLQPEFDICGPCEEQFEEIIP